MRTSFADFLFKYLADSSNVTPRTATLETDDEKGKTWAIRKVTIRASL